jgi:hypothetical protein
MYNINLGRSNLGRYAKKAGEIALVGSAAAVISSCNNTNNGISKPWQGFFPDRDKYVDTRVPGQSTVFIDNGRDGSLDEIGFYVTNEDGHEVWAQTTEIIHIDPVEAAEANRSRGGYNFRGDWIDNRTVLVPLGSGRAKALQAQFDSVKAEHER